MKIILNSTEDALVFGKKYASKASIFRKLKKRYSRTNRAFRRTLNKDFNKASRIATAGQLFREAYESVKGRIR